MYIAPNAYCIFHDPGDYAQSAMSGEGMLVDNRCIVASAYLMKSIDLARYFLFFPLFPDGLVWLGVFTTGGASTLALP